MSVATTRAAGTQKDAWTAPLRALRLEKPRESGTQCGEDRSSGQSQERRGHKPSRRRAYHFDTAGHVPLWNGPVLAAPFAAQVIGQALHTNDDEATSARLAYRLAAQIGHTHLLDDSV